MVEPASIGFATLLGVLVAASARAPQESDPATSVTVAAPPTTGANRFHPGHRAPLLPEPLIKLPVGAVRARGWLARQLALMGDGMFGRLPELSHWCRAEGNAWRSKDGSGECGWEELPYWLKGLTSLAFVLDEGAAGAGAPASGSGPRLRELATGWLEAILASQREDGYFGPESNRAQPDLWPNMPVLWAMRTWHEATGDPRILAFLSKYFRYELDLPRERLLPDSWQKVRGGDNLDVVHWLYDHTGEPWLLELAQRIHERTDDWTGGIANWHGVNFCQGFREPLQHFVQSHDPRHRDATARNYAEMMAKFGQTPGGMFAADENCREGYADPRQGAEACSMVEYMLSFELLGAQTGDTIWFDRCEEVAFNSLPAAMDEELRALHYLTAANLAVCDAKDHSPGIQNGGCMLAFSPDERYRCCQHNVVMGWPYFAERLWMATRDGGLAAVMYAPSEVRSKVGAGTAAGVGGGGGGGGGAAGGVGVAGVGDARIEELTDYPFDPSVAADAAKAAGARVEFLVHVDAKRDFPLYLRIPAWCERASVAVNGRAADVTPPAGSFLRIERRWNEGDRVVLALPMAIRTRRFDANHGCVAIDRGSLTYALRIDESWRKVALEGDRWTREVLPSSPWNYGLVFDPSDPGRSFELQVRAEAPTLPEKVIEPDAERQRARRMADDRIRYEAEAQAIDRFGQLDGFAARLRELLASTQERSIPIRAGSVTDFVCEQWLDWNVPSGGLKIPPPLDVPADGDPFRCIVDLDRQLRERGIDFLLVTIPTRLQLYPELVMDLPSMDGFAGFRPATARLALALIDAGVEVLDLAPEFVAARSGAGGEGNGTLFLEQNSHWTPRGAELAAKLVAERIARFPWFERGPAQEGKDWIVVEKDVDVALVTGAGQVRERTPRVHTVVRPGEEPLLSSRSRSSPITLLGSTFADFHRFNHCDFLGQLYRFTGWPIDEVSQDSEMLAGCEELARKSSRAWRMTRTVVWMVPELAFQRAPWWRPNRIFEPRQAASAARDESPPFGRKSRMVLHAKARRIPQWQLDHTGLVAPLQPSPVKSDSPVEEVELIPMGCARLRISAFPVIGSGPDAHEWKAPRRPARASFVHDDVLALDDGVLPKESIDGTIPRFTFWDHLGTTEWVQYDFEQPRRVGRSAVYWFDDTGSGRCRVPKSWRLLWLDDAGGSAGEDGGGAGADGGGAWREVELTAGSGYGVAPDRLNGVTFTPVTTTALRLEVTLQPDVSTGLFEWSVGE